jgi:tape measure domain-containing protein
VSKYSADIEIAVRGGQQLDRTIKTLNRLNNSINVVTRNAKLLEGKGFNVASIENYSRAVSKAERAVRKAAEGTNQERQAITALVSAMELENKARERKNILIAREIANQRRVIATANAGVGMQGPAIPAFMRTGPSSPIRGSRALPGSPAALAAGATGGRPARGGGGGGRLGGAISGSIIGGSFPLLFGQGAGAAAGGAVGGLVGGLAGPGGSFAGSLLGTLLGDIASKGQQIKELGADIGFSAEQTIKLQEAFKLAGQDAEKFTAAVQNIRGLGLSIEDQADAINLVSQLTETYGGRIDKVTSAFANAVESGKVTQATLNQLTNEGITVQDALAQKYGVSRSAILQMAKDGTISVQALVDVLVNMGNTGVSETTKTKSGFDRLKTSVEALGSALAALGNALVGIFQGPFNFILESLALITKTAAESINIISDLLKFSNPTKLETTAAIQAGRMPRGGKQSVVDVIGQQRLSALEQKAGPGFLGLGTNVPKVLELLKQEPEFKATRTKIGKIEVPSQLPPSGGGGGGKSASDRAAEEAAREAARVAELVRARQLATIELQRQAVFSREIAQAEMDKDPILVRQRQGQQELMRLGIQTAAELEKEKNSMAQLAIAREAQAKRALILLGIELDVAKIEQERAKNFEDIIADLDFELKLKQATTEEAREQLRLENELRKLKGQGFTDEQMAQITGRQIQLAAPDTAAQTIEQRIGKLKDEVAELTNIGNIAITVADGIGVAFSQAFQGLISGSMSAEEALGSFFKSVGDMFVSMAAEIIAKQMTMIILQTILKALGAVGGGGGGGGGNSATALGSNPNVAAYSSTGIGDIGIGTFGRAGGGPTAAGTPYLVGERGPELFVPGSNGGVMSNNDLRSAMNSQGGGGAGSPVLNMSFESTTIGGVEYVSRDQLEQAMAETRRAASRDGAQRGMTMTLDRIQNSSSTRRRIGV